MNPAANGDDSDHGHRERPGADPDQLVDARFMPTMNRRSVTPRLDAARRRSSPRPSARPVSAQRRPLADGAGAELVGRKDLGAALATASGEFTPRHDLADVVEVRSRTKSGAPSQ